MRRFIFTLLAFTLTITAIAQTKKKGNPNSPWKKGGWISLNLAQGGTRNWAAGGEKFSLAFAGWLNLWANRTAGKHDWQNSVDIAYALVNTHSQGVRRNDDKLDWVTKYTYNVSKKFSAGVFWNLRGQMTNGYDYEDGKRRTSGFFAPAYATFAPGFELKATKDFTVFATPVAARWVVFTNKPYSFNHQGGIKPDGSAEKPLAEMYGVDPVKKVRFEVGPFISASFRKEVMKNVYLRSRLDLQSDLTHDEPLNIDVYFTNMVGFKVNKWLQATYSFDVLYDNEVKMFGTNKNTTSTQLKSMMGIGLATKF